MDPTALGALCDRSSADVRGVKHSSGGGSSNSGSRRTTGEIAAMRRTTGEVAARRSTTEQLKNMKL